MQIPHLLISFLGFMVAQRQLSPGPAKVTEWPTPSSNKQLHQFLGFANFYRSFIRDYSKVATPLTRLTSTLLNFRWTPEAEAAFNRLKGLFSSSPILTHLVGSVLREISVCAYLPSWLA